MIDLLTKSQTKALLKEIGHYYKAVLDEATATPYFKNMSKPHEVDSLALHGAKVAAAAGKAHTYYNVMCVLENVLDADEFGGISKEAILRYMIDTALIGGSHGQVKANPMYLQGVIGAQQTIARLIG